MSEYSDLNSRFHVAVSHPETHRDVHDYFTDEVNREAVVALSKDYPGHTVTVSRFARVRLSVKDGAVLKDNPDLDQFYLPQGTDEWKQMCEEWKHMCRSTTGSENV